MAQKSARLQALFGLMLGVYAVALGDWTWLAFGAVLACYWRLAGGWLLLGVMLGAWHWRIPTIEEKHCVVEAVVVDFAQKTRAGLRWPLKVAQSQNCAGMVGRKVFAQVYQPKQGVLADSALRLGALYRFDLDKVSVERTRYGVRIMAQLRQSQWLADKASRLADWRGRLDALIDARFSASAGAWVKALLLGERGELSAQSLEFLTRTGTRHLLAISGLHIGLVALFAYSFLRVICVRMAFRYWIEPHSVALLGGLLLSLGYVVLSGAGAPSLRAYCMLMGATAHWFLPRVGSGREGLVLAAIGVVLLEPAALFMRGAWLSFLATLVVLVVYERWRSWSVMAMWLGMQGVLNLALLGISWAWFGGVSLSAFIVNLLVVPWLGVVLWAVGIALLLGGSLPFLLEWAEKLLSVLLACIEFFARCSWGYWRMNWRPDFVQGGLMYLMVLAGIGRRWYILGIGAVLVGLWQWRVLPTEVYTPNGNAAVLRVGRDMMVVNGGYRTREYDEAERYLLPVLQQHAKAPIAIILTRREVGSLAGLETLVRQYPDVPIYTTIPILDLPYRHQYCPDNAVVVFTKMPRCTAQFGEFRISAEGIVRKP